MTTPLRTFYVLVEYTDGRTVHSRGTTVQYDTADRQADELLRRGVLSTRPVRRQPGDTAS
jgi:hypothetical protein